MKLFYILFIFALFFVASRSIQIKPLCNSSLEGFNTSLPKKRGDATYYHLGLTSCGEYFSDNDLVVAIGFNYWTTPNPNNYPMCKKYVWIKDPSTGKAVYGVQVKDKCQSCGTNNIDLSPRLFQIFRNLDVGRFTVDWDFS